MQRLTRFVRERDHMLGKVRWQIVKKANEEQSIFHSDMNANRLMH
ncbi:unnamed protein product [Haemonchus placei]|uniref:Transposase n=1 Tax=Haemonchus placei TaxID=6290 RepID=A0A0N4WLW7_HAEPC|nr:unnamed protein product [Haemonchus placei]